ncbi:HNHc domain containing protein [Microcystis phage Mwe-JY08]
MSKRTMALRVRCPDCGADRGKRCVGKNGPRVSVHMGRIKAAAKQDAPLLPSEFYRTDAWRRLRYDALKLHGGACQCCGARARPGNPLHVDHIKPRSRFRALELDIANLQVLCGDCNLGKGARDQTDWRSNEARS